jgi:asparagine synthetase A
MDNLTEIAKWAPWLLVAYMFFKQNKMFVTPEQFETAKTQILKDIESKYVQKAVHDIEIKEMKSDMADIKEMVSKIYDKLYGID